MVQNGWRLWIMALWTAGGAASAAAQASSAQPDIPPAYMPPPGMCRVWLRDVPPVQQPAPTDCRSALRTKPVGATVVYGPETKRSSLTPGDWSRPSLRPGRDDDRARTPFRSADDPAGAEGCADAARDGHCDGEMPSMRSAVLWTEGQRPADLQRWFGSLNVAARFAMPSRGGSPDRVQWFDTDGHLVQVWSDKNGDGRADLIEMYNHEGARVRVVRQ